MNKIVGQFKKQNGCTGWAFCLLNCPMNSKRKNDLCKVLSDYTRKMGTQVFAVRRQAAKQFI
jgi:coenzyme F420-reducing hydrogenase gamma subunit